jgi:hypothetical protein
VCRKCQRNYRNHGNEHIPPPLSRTRLISGISFFFTRTNDYLSKLCIIRQHEGRRTMRKRTDVVSWAVGEFVSFHFSYFFIDTLTCLRRVTIDTPSRSQAQGVVVLRVYILLKLVAVSQKRPKSGMYIFPLFLCGLFPPILLIIITIRLRVW